MGFAVRGHHLPPKILSEKFPLEESFFCRQHWTASTGFFDNRRKFFVRVKQSRYFPGCMALNPLLHVIQSCAGGRSKGEISAFVDSIAPEFSAGRVFPLSAALDRVHWLLSQQKKVFREGEAISLFSGMHGT